MTKYVRTSEFFKLKKLFSSNFFSIFFSAISGLSVFYFLYFFGAYGIEKGLSYSGHTHLFRSISFGVLTFGYLVFLETVHLKKFKISNLRYLVLWYSVLIILGSQLIFLLFNFFWNWQEWNLEAYGLIMKEFPLMMVIPLSFYLIIKTISKPKDIEREYILFQSENGKDQLKIIMKNFLYANSSDNYVAISYLSNNQFKQHLIRKTLKVLERELKMHPEITRVHRSYIVNTKNVDSIKQNKGTVTLKINEASIPVSKKFRENFLN